MTKFLAILGALLVSTGAATAAPLGINTGWYADQVTASATDSTLSPFTFTLVKAGDFRLTDAFIPGDTYTVYNGATLLGMSTFDGAQAALAPIGDPIGEAAWTDAAYSHLDLGLAPGTYTLRVQSDCGSAGCPSGFYVRADEVGVPAPASFTLFGLGVIGTAVAARRRK